MKQALTADSCRFGFEVISARRAAGCASGGTVEGTELGLMHSAAETETRLHFLCCLMATARCFGVREDISEKFISWYLLTGESRRWLGFTDQGCGARSPLQKPLKNAPSAAPDDPRTRLLPDQPQPGEDCGTASCRVPLHPEPAGRAGRGAGTKQSDLLVTEGYVAMPGLQILPPPAPPIHCSSLRAVLPGRSRVRGPRRTAAGVPAAEEQGAGTEAEISAWVTING